MRAFERVWAAYAISTLGTTLALGAFALIAVRVLHVGPAAVSALAAAGLAAGALVAVPLGPWVEFRRKRPVMIGMDVARFLAMASVPVAYVLGALTYAQLIVVAVISAACDIAFRAASGAFVKQLLTGERLLAGNARLEATTWTTTAVGPPLGGAAIGAFGAVVTVLANAVSFLLSAVALLTVGGREARPVASGNGFRPRELLDGWRAILADPLLRGLFANTVAVNGLILATEPLLSVLLLRDLGFPPWQYGLAFGLPCVAGFVGSRAAPRVTARLGRPRVLMLFGTLRACWLLGLVLVRPGLPGLVVVIAVEGGMIACIGLYNPVYATTRLERLPQHRVARALAAWSVTNNAVVASLTAVWGVVAALTSTRVALGLSGVLMLATPLLLPRRLLLRASAHQEHALAPAQ